MPTPQVYNKLMADLRKLALDVVANSTVAQISTDEHTVTYEVSSDFIEELCFLADIPGGSSEAERMLDQRTEQLDEERRAEEARTMGEHFRRHPHG